METTATTNHTDIPSSLAQTPRQLTPRAKRRSWGELPVRIWLVLAVAVALITAYFTIDKYLSGRYERWLITSGTPLQADVMWINGVKRTGEQFIRTDRLQAQLGYTPPGGQRMDYVEGWMAKLPDVKPVPTIRIGEKIPIRIDPKNPKVWTDRTEPKPWLVEFTIVILLLPLLALLLGVAFLRRQQILGVWRRGELAQGVVVDHKQTAVAPLSRVVRFTLAEGDDRRVFSTLHPSKEAPQPGEALWLIFPPGNPARSIVATLYSS